MKTNFRRRFSPDTAERKRVSFVALALVLGALAFALLRGELAALVSPIWRSETVVSRALKVFAEMLRNKDTLAHDNLALRERASSYDALLLSYRALEASEEDLLGRFGRAEPRAGIAAGVLTHPPLSPYDELTVDAGSAEGASAGSKVSLPEGGALGMISEALPHISRVALYTSSGEKTSAILERGNLAVTLTGAGGGTFKLSLPREALVEAGDRILLPGLRSELVGVVRDITLEPTDAAKHITASGVANVGSVRFVLIR